MELNMISDRKLFYRWPNQFCRSPELKVFTFGVDYPRRLCHFCFQDEDLATCNGFCEGFSFYLPAVLAGAQGGSGNRRMFCIICGLRQTRPVKAHHSTTCSFTARLIQRSYG